MEEEFSSESYKFCDMKTREKSTNEVKEPEQPKGGRSKTAPKGQVKTLTQRKMPKAAVKIAPKKAETKREQQKDTLKMGAHLKTKEESKAQGRKPTASNAPQKEEDVSSQPALQIEQKQDAPLKVGASQFSTCQRVIERTRKRDLLEDPSSYYSYCNNQDDTCF